MKPVVARALVLDAFYQVLDNRIFRFLLTLVGFLVALSFVFGFREDRIEILWGWQAVDYRDAFKFLGAHPDTIKDMQATAIAILQKLFADFLGGTLGLAFCLAATAFFVPRSLEKGSADVLFSKPVSRWAVFLSRYAAGLIFVGLLATGLVGGLYLGFRLVSGYDDPGFLWTIATLVYLFGILHGVSVLIGAVTRSTVAAILITLVFFMGTGCIHQFWRIRAWSQETELAKELREEGLDVPEVLDVESKAAEQGAFVRFFLTTLDTLHYVLPKTSDASRISGKLRRAVESRFVELEDVEGKLTLTVPPAGFVRRAPAQGAAADLAAAPARWELDDPQGAPARVELARRPRSAPDENGRTRRTSASRAARTLEDELVSSGRALEPPVSSGGQVDGTSRSTLTWTEEQDGRRVARVASFFVFGDWLFELQASAGGLDPPELATRVDQMLDRAILARDASSMDPDAWYDSRFGWDEPLPYNVFFSIGSSLAFLLVVLAVGCFRISRIDF